MTIQEQMQITAAGIKERIAGGEHVGKHDLKFLQSFVNINVRKATNAGRRRNPYKSASQKVN